MDSLAIEELAPRRTLAGVEVQTPTPVENILTPDALEFVATLHRAMNPTRMALLAIRARRQEALTQGKLPEFPPEMKSVREEAWQVAPIPPDLQKRWVEITGPVERKMMINALNSGADVFMADFEDALSPTWANLLEGQQNLKEAVRRTIELTTPDGKSYRLNAQIATLMVRPRGWHLNEKHVLVDDEPISASLFDFGLYLYHNVHELLKRGTGPYFYLAKLENHHEARLWNDTFNLAQDLLNIPRGTIRVTVLIETILAAFEMEEILYELREHITGLNAGRWDYLFSVIKKFRNVPGFVLPDRAQVPMTVPFMRAYTERLVQVCHKRGAHAIGGMAAFIPSRKDETVNRIAIEKVQQDKLRESGDGFDGTWVAHPDLVPVVRPVFEEVLGERPHQKDQLREDVRVTGRDLMNWTIEGGTITEAGVRANINIGMQYLESWLRGVGAAAIYNLMEDTATAEISRAQLWQWIRHGAKMDDGRPVTPELYRQIRAEEFEKLNTPGSKFEIAAQLLDELVLSDQFIDFLTIPAMDFLD
ncbi:MAG: malate synthase A [Anaerolineales bacterium]|nr:malate synthase A [Anaerolineales bacterium]